MATTRKQIGYGSQGSEVTELQKTLNSKGYSLSVDGIFGSKTQAAVKDYQQKNNLSVDGIVGVNTWGSLLGGSTGSKPAINTAGTPKSQNNPYTNIDLSVYDKGYQKTDAQIGAEKKMTDAEKAVSGYGDFSYSKHGNFDEIWDKIMNREKFSYDLNGDALYQQYKDKYIKQGQMAMMDTMGQAAAMNGGYGSSYGQMVGQQAYQASLENLNDIVPELYQMAYDKYNQEGQDLLNQYSMLSGDRAMEYGMWGDKYNQLVSERDYFAGRADTEYQKGYGEWSDNRTHDTDQYWNETDFGYGQHRDEVADEQWEKAFEYQQERDEIADEQWQKEYELQAGKQSGSSGGSGYDNEGLSSEDIKTMQKALGITADGKWGSASKSAAGGLGAYEAWRAFQSGTLKKTSSEPDTQAETKEYYSDWDALDWNAYFAQIRQKNGQAAAEKELEEFTSKGLIPTNMVTHAASGARGGKMGH